MSCKSVIFTQHVTRALVGVSFTHEHYLTFHLHSYPTIFADNSHGDILCEDASNVTFGPLAEPHSPTGYESKDLTEEDTSVQVKQTFFHRPSMTAASDSAESIATRPLESDFDDEQIRNMLASPLYLQKREANADRSPVDHSFRENSVLSSSHFRDSSVKPAAVISHKRKSSQETLSDREGLSSGHQPVRGEDEALSRLSESENAAKLALKEPKVHLLAEAKSEVLKQECRADFLDCSTRKRQRQIRSSRMEIDHTNLGHGASRTEQARLHEESARRERALRETHIKVFTRWKT